MPEQLLGLAEARVSDHVVGECMPEKVRVDAAGDTRSVGNPTDEGTEGLRRAWTEAVVVLPAIFRRIAPTLSRKYVLVGAEVATDAVGYGRELVADRNPALLATLADI